MKSKTINAVIKKKINHWINSITDDNVKAIISKDIIVTGGSITSMLLDEKINDYDIYFRSKEAVLAVSKYYANEFNKANKDKKNKLGKKQVAYVVDGADIEKWKNNQMKLTAICPTYPEIDYGDVKEWSYDEKSEGSNDKLSIMHKVSGMILNTSKERVKIIIDSDGIAEDSDSIADDNEYEITNYLDAISDGDSIEADILEDNNNLYKPIFLSTNAITLSGKIQLIIRFYGDPKTIHDNYDFIHATNYWDSKTNNVTLNQRALEAILNKELHYVGSKYPIASLIRTRKFIKRGWQINAGQYVKMAFQISELNLNDIYVLEDQLVGVDSIYFLNFINQVKLLKLKKDDFNLTQSYLSSVIDRIFG